MRHAVKLIRTVIAKFQIVQRVVGGIRIRPVLHLQPITRADKGGINKAVYTMSAQNPVLLQRNSEVTSLPRQLAKDPATTHMRSLRTVRHVVDRSDAALVGDFIEPIPVDRPPLFHIGILAWAVA